VLYEQMFVFGSVGRWRSEQLAQSHPTAARLESEYYVGAYARHYNVPVRFVWAIVEQESSWRPCPVSPKGAAGLMQLMPVTAARLGVRDRRNISENVSGGGRYLAWLARKFSGDLRLAAAAYLAGEELIAHCGLLYRNREVVAYMSRITFGTRWAHCSRGWESTNSRSATTCVTAT
jgi:soluble lytic murein transglycosylase-like protein